MKLDKIWIAEFKNLRDVTIDFDESNLMTILVGWNGAGKSNVMEALVLAFRNLDLGVRPEFSYELKYQIKGHIVTVKATKEDNKSTAGQYNITVVPLDAEKGSQPPQEISINKFKRSEGGTFLPTHVFAYYSGPSRRLEEHFQLHQEKFRDDLLYRREEMAEPLRPFFYARPVHSQFVLLGFFLGNDLIAKEFLQTRLGIEALDSILFVMKTPYWAKNKKALAQESDRRFWGAKGTVSDFLSLAYAKAIAPHRVKRRIEIGLGIRKTVEFLYLFVPDLLSFRQLAEGLSASTLFKMLESTYISDVIREVRIRVKIRGSDGTLTFRELSEGEQQLLVVLGLLRFTGEAESLFLLDEPDTHLNPSWAVKYLSFLRDFVPNRETSHIILATHNPLAIAELEKGQVQIMWRDDNTGKVCASPPAFDPRGQGFARILTSDMFGLESTLDEPTQKMLRERREIVEKATLDDSDKAELRRLNKELSALGFQFASVDPDFEEYLQAKHDVVSDKSESHDPATPKQVQSRRKIAKEIVSKLLAENKQK